MEYYILVNNVKQGPFQKEELIQKGITGNTLVWCAGMSDWKKASEVADLTDILQQMPPEPPQVCRLCPKPGYWNPFWSPCSAVCRLVLWASSMPPE